jgi:two-component system, sensor histidine kinase and response regulator
MDRAVKNKNDSKRRLPKQNIQPHVRKGTPKTPQRNAADSALREREQRYRDLFEMAPIGIYKTTPDGRILLANRKLMNMMGDSSFEEMIQHNLEREAISLHPSRRQFKELVEREGEIKGLESTWVRRDGSIVYVSENARAIRGSDGKVLYYEGTVEDITESKRVEQALAAEKERLAITLRSVGDGVITTDAAENIKLFNQKAEELTGWTQAEAMEKPLEDVFHIINVKMHQAVQNPARKVLKSGVVSGLAADTALISKDGTERILSCSVAPMRDAAGLIVGVVLVFRDVTRLRRAEELLAQERNLLRTLIDALPEHVFVKDSQGRYLVNNWSHLDFLNVSDPDALLGKTVFDCYPPELAAQYDEEERRVMQSGQPLINREQVLDDPATGKRVWHIATKTPLRDGQGKIIGLVGTSQDITERKSAEGTLEQRNDELALLNKAVQSLNSSLDLDQVLVMILEAVRQLLNVDICSVWLLEPGTDELVCRQSAGPHSEIVRGWRLRRGTGLVGMVAQQGKSLIVQDSLKDERQFKDVDRQSGQSLRSLLTVPLWVREKVIGVLQVASTEPGRLGEAELRTVEPLAATAATAIQNAHLYERAWQVIEERIQAEETARQAQQAAEAANRARGEFLSRMSHEIRTPIHGIIGMTQLTLDTHLSDDQRQYLEMIKSSADSLLEIINDILDFSKIEARRLELEAVEFDLRPVVELAANTVAVRAHQKNLELICHIEPDVPTKLVGDPRRLQQVLVNLLGNAVKFTEQGEIVIHVQVDSETAEKVDLHITVSDSGIGIPEDKQDLIFEAFNQVDGSATRRYGGTGLGLAISRQLVELMGGQIGAESHLGVGSTFHFTIPLSKPKGETQRMPTASDEGRGMNVLVVDDNATYRHVLSEMLGQWGFQTFQVENGLAALERLRENGTNTDIVLLDKHLPDLDGFDVAARMMAADLPSSKIVLLLTTDNLPNDTARCRELGIAKYLVKPIRQLDLINVVLHARTVPKVSESAPDAGAPVPSQGRSLRVLFAEDNLASQLIGKKTLERAGHTLAIANTGSEVLKLLDEGTFDVILMDVEMPQMDGLEATRIIRQKELETGRHQLILAVTAYAMKEDQERCMAAGVDGYLSKPLSPDKLISALEQFFPRSPEPSSAPVVDLSAALEVTGEDRELLRESVAVFLERDYPRQLEELKEGIGRRDASVVKKAAHGLKGALASFGSLPAHDLALQIETMGRNGDLQDAERALAEFEAQMTAFKDYYARSTWD